MDELLGMKAKDLNKTLNPQEYFDAMKEKKNNITSEALKKIYENCMELANKYRITGQIRGLRKILFCYVYNNSGSGWTDCFDKLEEIIQLVSGIINGGNG